MYELLPLSRAGWCNLWSRQCDWIWSAGDQLFMCGRQSRDRNFKLLFYLFCNFLRSLTKGNVNHEECTDNVISYQFHVQSCLNCPYLITIVKSVIYMFG